MDLADIGMPRSRRRAPAWRKSRYSNPSGNCVEVAELPAGRVAVRDSRDSGGPALIFSRAEWRAFLSLIRGTRAPHAATQPAARRDPGR